MKEKKTSQPWVAGLSRLCLITAALLLLAVQSVLAQNAGVTINFNTPGQFTSIPTNILGTNDFGFLTNPSFPNGVGEKPAIFEAAEGGTGSIHGSRALDLRVSNLDTTVAFLPLTWDFSQVGAALKASIMIKLRYSPAPTSNARATQIGFVLSTNLVNTGISANAGQAFMSVILQSTAQPAYQYQLHYQTKPAAGTTATEVTPTDAANTILAAGTWYKLTATFANASATTITIAATLEDWGQDGLGTAGAANSVVTSFATSAPITIADLPTATKLYLALRTSASEAGVDYWDDISVQSSTGDVGVQPLAATTSIPGGGITQLYAKATGDGPYTYQWSKDGTPIPGQTNWKLIIGPAKTSDAGVYSVSVTGKTGPAATTSTTVSLSANPLSIVSVGSVDGGLVGVMFNQPVDETTAKVLANYSVNGASPKGVVVMGARVILTPVSTLTGPYTVTVQNVADLSGTAIASGASANGRVEGFIGMDVGGSALKGWEYSFAPGQFEITGGGSDIWNANDQFHFLYKQRTGDFDIAVKVPYMDANRNTAKAGIDVRDSLAGQALNVLTAANPPFPARNFHEGIVRQQYNLAAVSWGSSPVFNTATISYPNVWIRLRRTGQNFTRYSSGDGVAWTLDGTVNVPLMPQTVYYGLAVCATAQGELERAVFENLQDYAGPAGSAITMVTQPPATLTVNAGSGAAITLAATWSGTPTNQLLVTWQRSNGSGGFTNVLAAGATGGAYTTPNLYSADSGAQFRAVLKAPGAADVTSDVTTVTVTDTVAPTATASIPANVLYQVQVQFSEPVATASATATGNYTVNRTTAPIEGLTVTSVNQLDPRTVELTVNKILVAGDYTIQISGVQDTAGNTIATVTKTVTQNITPPFQQNYIEFYDNLANSDINGLIGAMSSAKFVNRIPDWVAYTSTFGYNIALADTDVDNYLGRMISYFVPPTTGLYRFYMASDDSSILYMSTNAAPADSIIADNKVEIGRVTAFNATYAQLAVANIQLTAGQKYYMEALWKEGGGGDGIRVAARISTDTSTPPATEAIPAAQLAFPKDYVLNTPIAVEIYNGGTVPGSVNGNTLADLDAAVASGAFVNHTPNLLFYEKDFAYNRDLSNAYDNYLGRLFSYFVPDHDGLYRVWARADDSYRVYMNTNAVDSTNPAGMVQLVSRNGFIATYDQQAQNIPLVAGQKYYIEARWKEGGGGDGFSLVFKDQSDDTVPNQSTTDSTLVDVQRGYDPDNAAAAHFEFPSGNFTALGPVKVASISPLNPTVGVGQRITFSIPGIGGTTPAATIWLKNGQQVYANANSFTTEPLTLADNGAVFTVVVTNAFSGTSLSSTVTVAADPTSPSFLSAVGSHLDTVRLQFSEALDRASAINAANYTFTPSLGIIRIAYDEANRNSVLIYTTPLTPGASYGVNVSNVKDWTGNLIASATKTFSGWTYGGKGLYAEVFTGPGGTSVIGNLFTDPAYMNNNPAFTGYLPEFNFGTNPQLGSPGNNFTGGPNRDNFGVRVSGLFLPPHDGFYRFYVRGDDETRLYMNTNGPSAYGKVSIARNLGANSSTYLNGTGDTQAGANSYSPVLNLQASNQYYIEGYLKEGGGGDMIDVTFAEVLDPTNDDPRIPGAIGPFVNSGGAGGARTDIAPGDYFRAPGNPDLATITFPTQPPATVTLPENGLMTLSFSVAGVPAGFLPAVGYQWQKFNSTSGLFENIDGATGTTYSKNVTAADAGQYRAVVRIPTADRVFTTTLTVSGADTTPPTVAAVLATNRFDKLIVKFSEPVTAASAGNKANYTLSGGATVSSVNIIDSTTVELVTSTLDPDTTYSVTVSGISDNAGLTMTSSQTAVMSWNLSKGFWKVDFFYDSSSDNVSIASFIISSNYVNNVVSDSKIVNGPFSSLRTYDPAGNLRDFYGARAITWFTPPSDGDYRFFVRVDDQIYLYLSTDDKPENIGAPIASDTATCCEAFRDPPQPEASAPITLQAGKRYFMMAVMREQGGGDFFEVAFRKEGDTTAAANLQPIPAQYLALYGDPSTPLTITAQPASIAINEGTSTSFTVKAVSPYAVGYQWQKNTGSGWVDIANATSGTFTTPVLGFADSGIKYRAIISGYGHTVPSNEATVTVNHDTTGPTLVSARTYTSPNTVTVRFNEAVGGATSTLFSDDFAAADIDPLKWTIGTKAFETGTADTTVAGGGQLTMTATNTGNYWGGTELVTVPTFTASASQNLKFSVDRVSTLGSGTSVRATIRIRDTSGTNYIVFSQNTGEGGWEYNRQVNIPGDSGTGSGPDIALFDTLEDSASHNMAIVANGTTAKLYLDGLLGAELPFPVTSGIMFEIASYVRQIGDTVTNVFDNAKVERIQTVGTYTINGATVNSVDFGSAPNTVVLHTTDLNPSTSYTLTVNGVSDTLGNLIIANSTIGIDQGPAIPAEFLGGTVAGFQDDFTAAARDTRWVPRGPGGDVYIQANGVLRVTSANGDPNHLLFEDPSYDKTGQEVLARVRIKGFGTGDLPRGGVSASVNSLSQGYNFDFRDEGTLFRHMEFLDDNRSWGTEFDIKWSNDQWYWLRFKLAQNTDAGAPDMWGKIWKADGTEAEPQDWQTTWDDTRTPYTGYAGISASSNGGFLDMEVDYILIKAAGLPQITPAATAVTPPVLDPKITSFTTSAGNLTITWQNGGELQSAPAITGPWTGTGDSDGSYTTAIPAGAGMKFFRVARPN